MNPFLLLGAAAAAVFGLVALSSSSADGTQGLSISEWQGFGYAQVSSHTVSGYKFIKWTKTATNSSGAKEKLVMVTVLGTTGKHMRVAESRYYTDGRLGGVDVNKETPAGLVSMAREILGV